MDERKERQTRRTLRVRVLLGYINYLERSLEKKRKSSHNLRVHEESGEKSIRVCSETFPSMQTFQMW
jgi:cobyric acid synthase